MKQKWMAIANPTAGSGKVKQRWPEVRVGDIVKTVTENEKVNMSMEISEAIKKMGKSGLGHLVIMSGNKLKGIITKSDVMRFIKLQSEIH